MVTSGVTVVASAGAPVGPGLPASPPCSPMEGMPQRRSAENRRSNKPIMEKRRRARINNCLNELKTLILDAMKKDPARHSKLEKADILEMTVKHLENLQRQQVALATATDPTVINKYRAGFSECATEVGRFPGLEPAIRRRLLQHLAACLGANGTTVVAEPGATPSPPPVSSSSPPVAPLQLHIVSSETSPNGVGGTPPLSGAVNSSSNGIFFTTGAGGAGLQLVPTRLPNGDIALVLPSSRAGQLGHAVPDHPAEDAVRASPPPSPAPATSPLPMLIPIPKRTASTASAMSSASSFVSTVSTSPPAFDHQTQPHNLSTSPADHGLGVQTVASPSASPGLPMHHYPPSPLSNSSNSCGYESQQSYEEHKPLALVTNRKKYEMEVDDDQPWRPW